MKNNRLGASIMMLLLVVAPCWAKEASPDLSTVGTNPTPSVVGQAAEAVVGRVFGVEGDASDIKYHVIEFTSHTPAASATRSLLIPGWGQYFNHQKAKGTVFFLATLGTVVACSHVYGEATHSYDQYKAQGDKDSSKYDDYQRSRDQAVLLGGAAAVLWIVSIFDAYHNAYKPLYSEAPSMEVEMFKEGGAQVRLKKTF